MRTSTDLKLTCSKFVQYMPIYIRWMSAANKYFRITSNMRALGACTMTSINTATILAIDLG